MTIEKKKLNDSDLNIAGGKDKIKVKSWYYSCKTCGYHWDRFNHWWKPTINPHKSVKCPKCNSRVRGSSVGEFETGKIISIETYDSINGG